MSVADYLARLETALQKQPFHLELLKAWAHFSLLLGQTPKAIEHLEGLCQQAHRQSPFVQAELCLILGNLYFESGNVIQASQLFEKAIDVYHALEPTSELLSGLWNNLGQCYHRLHQLDSAQKAYQHAIDLNSSLIEAYSNLSALYLDLGQTNLARRVLNQAFALRQDYTPAWVNLGILEGLSENEQAALTAFDQARRLEPARTEPWLEAVFLLIKQSNYSQAKALCQQGIQSLNQADDLIFLRDRLQQMEHQKPDLPFNSEYKKQRNFRQLQRELGWGERFFLSSDQQQHTYLAELGGILEDWHGIGFDILNLIPEMRFLPEILWFLFYIGDHPHCELKQAFAGLFAQPKQKPLTLESPRKSGKLRIGVLVSPQHEGIFSQMGYPLVKQLHSEFDWVYIGNQSRFHKLGIHGSLKGLEFVNHLGAFARQIREQAFDMVYFWEAGSDCVNYFLPFFRLAPIQFVSWGMPITTGIPTMDYFLSTRLGEIPDAQSHYSEKLLLHRGIPTFACDPWQFITSDSKPLIENKQGKKIYLCIQQPLKYCRGFIGALEAIVQKDPDAELVLLGSQKPWIQNRLQAALVHIQERIQWIQAPISHQAFLSAICSADVILDTQQPNGGQTTDESLLMGIPLVTYPGHSLRTRLTVTKLNALDFHWGICRSWEEYASRACELAHTGQMRSDYLDALKNKTESGLMNPDIPVGFAELIYHMANEKGIGV